MGTGAHVTASASVEGAAQKRAGVVVVTVSAIQKKKGVTGPVERGVRVGVYFRRRGERAITLDRNEVNPPSETRSMQARGRCESGGSTEPRPRHRPCVCGAHRGDERPTKRRYLVSPHARAREGSQVQPGRSFPAHVEAATWGAGQCRFIAGQSPKGAQFSEARLLPCEGAPKRCPIMKPVLESPASRSRRAARVPSPVCCSPSHRRRLSVLLQVEVRI